MMAEDFLDTLPEPSSAITVHRPRQILARLQKMWFRCDGFCWQKALSKKKSKSEHFHNYLVDGSEILLSDKYIPLFTTGCFLHPKGGWPDFSLPQLSQLQCFSHFHHLDMENLGHPLRISCWTLQLGRWMNLNVICWGVLGVLKITTFEGWKYVRRFHYFHTLSLNNDFSMLTGLVKKTYSNKTRWLKIQRSSWPQNCCKLK